jgi:hypothetical protein
MHGETHYLAQELETIEDLPRIWVLIEGVPFTWRVENKVALDLEGVTEWLE